MPSTNGAKKVIQEQQEVEQKTIIKDVREQLGSFH